MRRFINYLIPRSKQKIAILRLEYPIDKKDIEHIKRWLQLLENTIPVIKTVCIRCGFHGINCSCTATGKPTSGPKLPAMALRGYERKE